MPRGHCLDYWRKWKREYNFCGLRPQDAKENDKYLILVDRIAASPAGLDGDFILDHFTAGAARPILRCKDAEIETKALNYVIACLKRGEDVTGGDLAASINAWLGKPEKKNTHLREEIPSLPMENKPTCAPIKSLGQRVREDEMQQAGDNAPITDTTGEVSVNSDKHVACSNVTIDPTFTPDTYRESPDRIRYHCVYPDGCRLRDKEPVLSPQLCGSCKSLRPLTDGKGRIIRESPFRTGADVLHAQKTGIAGEMYPHIVDANKMVSPPKVSPEERKQNDKQRRIDIAEQLVDAIGRDMPDMVRDILKEHPSWNTADVLYFGVQVLHERKGRV